MDVAYITLKNINIVDCSFTDKDKRMIALDVDVDEMCERRRLASLPASSILQ